MLVQLTMVTGRVQHLEDQLDHSPDADMSEGEDDGLAAAEARELAAAAAQPTPSETTTPVIVDTVKVRCFYPRKPQRDGTQRRGTRLTFDNGAGMAVTETFEEVAAKFGRAN
jgi:hypothetical protein